MEFRKSSPANLYHVALVALRASRPSLLLLLLLHFGSCQANLLSYAKLADWTLAGSPFERESNSSATGARSNLNSRAGSKTKQNNKSRPKKLEIKKGQPTSACVRSKCAQIVGSTGWPYSAALALNRFFGRAAS